MNGDLRVVRTASGARKLRGDLPLPLASSGNNGTEDLIARLKQLLFSLGDELKMEMGDELDVVNDCDTAVGRFVRLRTMVNGIPVFGSQLVAQVIDRRLVELSIARFNPGDPGKPQGRAETSPSIDAEAALALVKRALGVEQKPKTMVDHANATYFPIDDQLRLAWVVDVASADRDWRFVVDAETGKTLLREPASASPPG